MPHGERIGILGVGRMGSPIARNLKAAGFVVTVYDRDRQRSEQTGAAIADSGADLAAESDILISLLPGNPEVEDVMVGAGRLVEALPAHSLWLDLTSTDPRVAREIADRATVRSVESVGAPMAGGPSAAETGSLRFYTGGTPTGVNRVRPILATLGTMVHVGEAIEAGYTAKLLANLLWFGQAVAVTEALLLGQALGLSPAVLRDQLAVSAGGSVFIDEYLDRLLEGDYLASFGIDRCVEELDTLVALAQGAGVPFEMSSTIARLHREALERFGAIDGELLGARLLEERAGRTLRR
jgi:3-hydroxyisobutyrate dehydrogenase